MRIVHAYINNMHINLSDENQECFADKWNLPSLVKAGHEIVLVCGGNNKQRREYAWKGVKVIELPVLFEVNKTSRIIKGFIKELLKQDADIFHAHHYSPFLPETMLVVGKLVRKPVFLTIHVNFCSEKGIRRLLEYAYASFMQPFLPFYQKVFFTTDYYLEKSMVPFLPRKKKILCQNKYILPPIPEKAEHVERKENKILFLGRLESIKGIDILLRAFAIVQEQKPEVQLHLVGEGTDKENLMKLSEKLNVKEKVFFHGALFGGPKWSMLYTSTLLVLPHRDFNETNVCTEGYLCGTPTIVSSSWSLPRDIRNNHEIRERMVFMLPDHRDLAKKILFLLDHKEVRDRISRKLKEVRIPITTNIGYKIMIKEYQKSLDGLR